LSRECFFTMSVTPMMQQYRDAKAACPGALLLFRMGDFYELFDDDAQTAARVLGLALTTRDKHDNPTPMAGFPYHQLESYLAKLIQSGQRVAICDQVEDAKQAKGLVRREVTRIVTPGTLTDDALLDPRSSNYLAAVGLGKGNETLCGIAWVELSTGRFQAGTFARARLADELARIAPTEVLLADASAAELTAQVGQIAATMITKRPDWAFSPANAGKGVLQLLGTKSWEGFGFEPGGADQLAIQAAGGIVDYLQETQRASLAHIDRLTKYTVGRTLELDESTRRSLELTRTLREGKRDGTLLSVLDRCQTPPGSRLLAEWLDNPLADMPQILARHDAVAELRAQRARSQALAEQLRKTYDLQRLLARIATGRASPRDLLFVGRTLQGLPAIKQPLAECAGARLQALAEGLDLCPELCDTLSQALADECPQVTTEGGIIRDGYNSDLDNLRDLARGGKQWIAGYQAAEAERTGIPSLKVGFNKVFGYYIEVTNTHGAKIPPEYIRKQTVKNAERYITPQLKEYEERVLSADDKAKQLEYTLFVQLRDEAARHGKRLQSTAAALAELDVLLSLAEIAAARGYVRPTMLETPFTDIVEGRHPVLEVMLTDGTFVANDTHLDDEAWTALITGPNMAGKSTYIRQVALITLMAQMGSFVPAKEVTLGVADRIFARVGASDELARGQSTFMVEMLETARILHSATNKSLVILDEIGRGTSTYDGLSLAWAVVEHLHEHVGCRTLFATHYHELTSLAEELTGLVNLNVAVREWNDDVVFLHKIVKGAADRSYGIHVARLAGVPREVIDRAKDLLAELESQAIDSSGQVRLAKGHAAKAVASGKVSDRQLTLFAPTDHPLVDKLRTLNVESLTPLDALQWLANAQQELGRS
jgi:DNA mismatch repair protein MutS